MRLIFHIGQHKTGSKALQYFLSSNQSNLAKHKILYSTQQSDPSCHAYQHSHYHFYRQLQVATQFLNSEMAQKSFKVLRGVLDSDIDFANHHQLNTIVMSAEDVFTMQTAHELNVDGDLLFRAIEVLKRLVTELNIDLQVVVYLRNTPEFLLASYAQYIKGESRGTLKIEEFFEVFQERLYPQKFLTDWKNVLGADAVLVRNFNEDRSVFDIRSDFVKTVLNLNTDQFDFDYPLIQSNRREVLNETPNAITLAILRKFNQYPRLEKYLPREILMDRCSAVFKGRENIPLSDAIKKRMENHSDFVSWQQNT